MQAITSRSSSSDPAASRAVPPPGAGRADGVIGADMRRNDSVLPRASLASIQLNPSGEASSCHSAGVRRYIAFRSRDSRCTPWWTSKSSTHQSSPSSADHSLPWPNSEPMNSSCLPGCAHMYASSERSPANRRHSSPGILPSSEPFPCTTSSCDSGRMKFSENA